MRWWRYGGCLVGTLIYSLCFRYSLQSPPALSTPAFSTPAFSATPSDSLLTGIGYTRMSRMPIETNDAGGDFIAPTTCLTAVITFMVCNTVVYKSHSL